MTTSTRIDTAMYASIATTCCVTICMQCERASSRMRVHTLLVSCSFEFSDDCVVLCLVRCAYDTDRYTLCVCVDKLKLVQSQELLSTLTNHCACQRITVSLFCYT
jgi:hypothetical protein